jgi:hypothetical protein
VLLLPWLGFLDSVRGPNQICHAKVPFSSSRNAISTIFHKRQGFFSFAGLIGPIPMSNKAAGRKQLSTADRAEARS